MDSGQKQLSEFIAKNIFRVPEYQRYYSWEEQHLDDLWTDLRTARTKDHYFGTFVIQETGNKQSPESQLRQRSDDEDAGYDIHLLIDGQQRLTTLTILLRSMYDALDNAADTHSYPDEVQEQAEEIKKQFLVYRGIYPLTLLDRDGEFLKNHIMEGATTTMNPATPSQRRLEKAKVYFDQQFNKLGSV